MAALTPLVIASAGVLGLLIGSFLNVVAYRVPAQISLLRGSRCPHCDTAIKPWHNIPVVSWIALGGKCATCGARISARYPIVELLTGLFFALVTWWILRAASTSGGESWSVLPLLLAFLYFAAISIVLTLIDLDTHRLPNSIVLPSYLMGGALLTMTAALSGEWTSLARAGIGMVVLYVLYYVLRLVRPGGMGGGDVKLAGAIGIYLGWVGWGALAVGAFSAFVFGGLYGVVLLVLGRAGRKTAIPFGPWMILGAWTGLFTGEPIGRWYVDLLFGN